MKDRLQQLDDLVRRITNIDVEEETEAIRSKGTEYLLHKNFVDELEHHRKIKIAELKEKHRALVIARNSGKDKKDQESCAEGRLDDLARIDDEYAAFLRRHTQEKNKQVHLEQPYFKLRNRLDLLPDLIKLCIAEMYFLKQS